MEQCISRSKPNLKLITPLLFLLLSLFFVTPSRAAEPRDLNTTTYTVPGMQLAHWDHHRHWRHHHWRHHNYCRYHNCHRHWRRW